MLQLIFHGIGDYLLQNHWMAINKKKKGWTGFWACQVHCITYTLPFLFIATWQQALTIYISHFIIDRTRIVDYFIAFKNNVKKYKTVEESKLIFGQMGYDISNFGYKKDVPIYLSMWLYIITDNVFHIICNYLSLTYL